MQLIFAFIILSIITLMAVLLVVLNKNSRSAKIRQIAQNNNWQYLEFINLEDSIKQANFGLLNYSQNTMFRHAIQGKDAHSGLAFHFFDCRAVEPTGIHNSSIILFSLSLPKSLPQSPSTDANRLHFCLSRFNQDNDAFTDTSHQQLMKRQYQAQKLIELAEHQIPNALSNAAFKNNTSPQKVHLYANDPSQTYQFLQHLCSTPHTEMSLINWLLSYPHLHIEVSNGMLLAYKKNQLIDESSLLTAITAVAELALILSPD